MNEDILKMARESGLDVILEEHASEYGNGMFSNTPYPQLERFYNLARAAEQDRCCRVIYGMAGSDNVAQRTVEKIRGKE